MVPLQDRGRTQGSCINSFSMLNNVLNNLIVELYRFKLVAANEEKQNTLCSGQGFD